LEISKTRKGERRHNGKINESIGLLFLEMNISGASGVICFLSIL